MCFVTSYLSIYLRMMAVALKLVLILELTIGVSFAVHIITPNTTEYTIQSGSNFSLTCQSDVPVIWTYPVITKLNPEVLGKDIIIIQPLVITNYMENNLHVSKLEIYNASDLAVGFYYCNEPGKNDSYTSLYLYVEDEEELYAGRQEVVVAHAEQYHSLVIPCRPTSPNVDVKLFSGVGFVDELKEIEMNVKAADGSFWSYLRTKGFTLNYIENIEYSYYTCQFVKGNVTIHKFVIATVTKFAPAVKVTYTDLSNLEETIRMLLKYGGIEFEDNRITKEDWLSLKPTTLFGQMPLYEENGKIIWQGIAICRYLAKKVKLAGSNAWENMEIDTIVDTITDFETKAHAVILEADKTRKEELMDFFLTVTAPFYLKKFDKIVGENNGYMAANKFTWADIYFFTTSEMMSGILGESELSNYKNLSALKERMLSYPIIKEWVDIKTKTEF